MGSLTKAQEAFDAAHEFLNPILNREEIQKHQAQSLLEILSRTADGPSVRDGDARTTVIGKALDIMTRIHAAFVTPDDQDESQQAETGSQDTAMEDAKRRRMLHALLDLISLEGIYPSLSSGVGIPLQQRMISVLPAGVIAKKAPVPASSVSHDESLLRRIMDVLVGILSDARQSIQPVILGRILSDIISGTADLAFNPTIASSANQSNYKKAFVRVIDDTPSATLLPTLSSFLQADTVPWFKSTVSSQISRVPLRPGGVLQTILFIASQFAPSLGQEAQSQASNGPHLTVQAIMQISKLLSSVPHEIDPAVYFMTIAPQLLELIDGDDLDLNKTAAYVVGNGILGKRAYGAPGTIGHSIFVEPLFRTLTAELDTASKRWVTRFADTDGSSHDTNKRAAAGIMVDGITVDLAVNRLRALALQHPNPGLVKRIVYPILVPLWGLACHTQEQELNALHEKVMALLQTYFGISVGVQPLKKLVDNLLWNGGLTWTYQEDSDGKVFLKKRHGQKDEHSNLIKLIDSLQSRVELFVSLLGSDPSSEERTGDIFLYVSEAWLVHPHRSKVLGDPMTQEVGEGDSIIQSLVSAKVAEKLLENFKDTLSRRPLRVLDLIKQVIEGELHRLDASGTAKRGQKAGNVSLSSLANIVPKEEKDHEEPSAKDSFESLSTAFSLLSTVLASAEFSVSQETQPLLESIKTQVDRLLPLLPPALSKPGTTSSMLLEIQLTSPEHDETKPPPPHISDLEVHRQALANLNSELPPVQAEGFSLLSKLIADSSPVLDIPSTLTLLLSIITDTSESSANEEFIYLNAIKSIGTLASRHPRTVVKALVDNYADKGEQRSLDQRLKIGESLLRTVQDLGEALHGETAKILGEGMVAVAGRRGHKPQAQQSRKRTIEKERRQREKEARKQKEPAMPAGWSISSGAASSSTTPAEEEDRLDDDSEPESAEQTAYAANIVAAWAAGTSLDEEPDDLRARASALSVLASAVQTNIIGLGPAIVASAVDLALATLTLEPAPESAILRRASVVLILDILKTLDTARETRGGKDIEFGFSLVDDESMRDAASRGPSTIGNIPSMLRTLAFVESREEDTIVRGHLRALIESLEAWLEKSLLWGIGVRDGHGDGNEPRLELGERIAGLDVDPMAGRDGSGRPRIEEIE
ncbi:hypothetical protein NUU61_004486 [Penicillium alfredii]|uniref:Protein required for cell viability n=1 Tax=Penicillium alfredii TaxID=1506179 RepID=A0A9W9FL68_9EURO|nr:uncharacterized protein NUU61_004486 [Penicillium alfredii]KAJ5102264.1 hypothetical protein NUU61_004486 [Penicillium alfredii]